MTLNQLIRERKAFVRILAGKMKEVDSAVERAERLLKRISSRKLKVPEAGDLDKLGQFAQELELPFRAYIALLAGGFPV